MSLPSASGDESFGNSKPQAPRYGAQPSQSQFMGGLPFPRSNSGTPGETPSSLSLPSVDANKNRIRERSMKGDLPQGGAPRRGQKASQPDSKHPRLSRKDDDLGHGKSYSGIVKSEDEDSPMLESSEDESESEGEDPLTIYDAVAGRLGYDGLLKDNQKPVSAADYLFRYQHGPEQDESYEQFSAHRHLNHRLPDSDLLKAVHAHASDFYGALLDSKDSFGSMDETALIAIGILLEEASAEKLGATGDLAFAEAPRPGEADVPKSDARRVKRQKIKHDGDLKAERAVKAESESSEEESLGRSSGQKRRRGSRKTGPEVVTEDEAEYSEETDHAEEDPSHNSEVESWISQTLQDSQGHPSSQLGTSSDLPFR